MEELHEIHKRITDEVKSLIGDMKIVFPSAYGRIFIDVASHHNVELKCDELLDREFIDDKIFNYIISLYQHADGALDAMVTNNSEKLIQIIEETKKLKEELSYLHTIIYEDSLTQAYTRQWFDNHLITKDQSAKFLNNGILVLVDMNDFKVINDTYGHVVGDKVLHYVAKKLKQTEGKVVRYGGDEFMIFFEEGSSLEEISEKIEKLSQHFKKVSFKHDGYTFKIGFAYGIVPFDKGNIVDEVIAAVDKSMYQNKKGRK